MNSLKTSHPPSSAQVLSLLDGICHPLPAERVSLEEALNRVLREAVAAPEDQPAFDRSSMDGYAIRQDEAGDRLQVVDEIRAGDWRPRRLLAGQAVRISTGGALPGSGLQVVMREDVRAEGSQIVLVRREPDLNIRFRGEDAKAGQTLIEPGTRLSAGSLALLASIGQAAPLVNRGSRVLHLATGNELVSPNESLCTGQIRDSNSTLVRAFLRDWGARLTQARVPEDASALMRALAEAGQDYDLVLISGGASVGEHDFTRSCLEQTGFTIHVSRTRTRPGKPLVIAQRNASIAFGLPGNPLAHFVCLTVYVRRVLEIFSDLKDSERGRMLHGTLAGELKEAANARETFWPARASCHEGALQLTPLGWSSSGDLTCLAQANALILIGPETAELAQGTRVPCVTTDRFL